MYNLPYATDYDSTATPVFDNISGITNLYGASIYYAHELGDDQVNSSGTTSINAFIKSDWDITSEEAHWVNRSSRLAEEMVSLYVC